MSSKKVSATTLGIGDSITILLYRSLLRMSPIFLYINKIIQFSTANMSRM